MAGLASVFSFNVPQLLTFFRALSRCSGHGFTSCQSKHSSVSTPSPLGIHDVRLTRASTDGTNITLSPLLLLVTFLCLSPHPPAYLLVHYLLVFLDAPPLLAQPSSLGPNPTWYGCITADPCSPPNRSLSCLCCFFSFLFPSPTD
jgi:hypothetical protein